MVELPGEVTVLGGGTGTPKLLWQCDAVLDRTALTVVANTGDDVEFGDLFVCPDIDACLFAAANRIDTDRWWGLTDDSTAVADALEAYRAGLNLDGTPRYRPPEAQEEGRELARWRRFEPLPEFMVFGDEDRAIHRARAAAIDRGQSLTDITRRLGEMFGVTIDIIPMSDDPVATWIETPEGALHFQDFWVARNGSVPIDAIEFRGIDGAEPTEAVREALSADAVVIGPSNPVTSIGPIIGLPEVQQRLSSVPVVAISPFIGADAFSGPAAELMEAAGLPVGTAGLEAAYPFVDALILDDDDPTIVNVPSVHTDIRIDDPADGARIWEAIGEAVELIQ